MKTQSLQAGFLALIGLIVISNTGNAQSWGLTGNAGTNPTTNFVGTTDARALAFRTNGVERMRIIGAGRIGIGTIVPKSKLHIIGTDYVSLSSPGYLMIGDEASYNIGMDVDVIQARNNGAAAALYLNYYGGYTYVGASGAVAVNPSGNFTTAYPAGINGSYNAVYALNVNASASYNGINVTDGGNAYSLNATKSGLLAGVFVSKTGTSTSDACVWGNSTGSATGVQGNSNTGVGVYGITNNSANYAGFFLGSVYTSGSYQASDLCLKNDVKDFTRAMDIINQLQPKTYQYKHDGIYKLMNLPEGERYGLIAEDLEKVLPGIVKQTKFETATDESKMNGTATASVDFKAVNYTELIPVLIKGMQEQQAVITKQQQQIDQLEQTVQSMANVSNARSVKANDDESSAYLMQNAPNPFTQSTTLRYYVPTAVKQAQLAVYNESGIIIKSYTLENGSNDIIISAGTLTSGQYTCVLIIDGKKATSMNMTITK